MSARTERSNEAFVQGALNGSRFGAVRWIAETVSTNDDLAALARDGAPEQVLIADLQTGGRGRRDRVWESPARSGVLMSVLLRNIDPRDGFWFVGAIALAASQAIDELTVSPCRLKWPNDVMLGAGPDQRKVAGVLAQLVDDAAIVGVGINCNWPDTVPASMVENGTAINRHLPEVARIDQSGAPKPAQLQGLPFDLEPYPLAPLDEPFVERGPLVADILHRAIGHLDQDRHALRAAWKSQCSTLGRKVRLELETGEIVGIAVDIAPSGALQLEEDGVQTTHQIGDVVHLRPDH